jgi:hypothetical protein
MPLDPGDLDSHLDLHWYRSSCKEVEVIRNPVAALTIFSRWTCSLKYKRILPSNSLVPPLIPSYLTAVTAQHAHVN